MTLNVILQNMSAVEIMTYDLPRLALRADVASRRDFLLAGVHVAEAHPQAGLPLPTTRVARESHPAMYGNG